MLFHIFWRWLRNAELEVFAAKLLGYGFTMYTSFSSISPDDLATLATVCSFMGGLFFVVVVVVHNPEYELLKRFNTVIEKW